MIDDRETGGGIQLQRSEMVTELSLPLRWMSDLIKVNGLRSAILLILQRPLQAH